MNNEEIFDKLLGILKNVNADPNFDYSKLNMDSLIFEDLGLDSIGFLYMVMGIQNEFQIKIKNAQFLELKTVGDLVNLIKNF